MNLRKMSPDDISKGIGCKSTITSIKNFGGLPKAKMVACSQFFESLWHQLQDHLNNCKGRAVTLHTVIYVYNHLYHQIRNFTNTHDLSIQRKFVGKVMYAIYRSSLKDFETLQDDYIKANNPYYVIEESKDNCWKLFKRICRCAETANIVSEVISDMIADGVGVELEKKTAMIVADNLMTSSAQFPTNKVSLIAMVLLNLGHDLEKDPIKDLSDFVQFFVDPFGMMELVLKKYAMLSLEQNEFDANVKLSMERKKMKSSIMTIILNIDATMNLASWLKQLNVDIRQSGLIDKSLDDSIVVLEDKIQENNTIETRKEIIEQLEAKLDLAEVNFQEKDSEEAVNILLKNRLIIGCKASCPLCSAFCELTTVDHYENDGVQHKTSQHWPNGLCKWRDYKTQDMVLGLCTSYVADSNYRFINKDAPHPGHLYKDYMKIYPSWAIPPDASINASTYWKWFCGKYANELAKIYSLGMPKIPEAWSSVSWQEAREWIETTYNVSLNYSDKSTGLEKDLNEVIVGQDSAVKAAAAAIKRKLRGWELQEPKKPLVLAFLGPSGTGKTELAKQIAKYWQSSDSIEMIRLDMSEYHESHTKAKLIGSPPGYVGYQDKNNIASLLKKKPEALILLDEIEKAHPEVMTIFFQMFDEGRLTTGAGETIHFPDAIFILTSNVATEEIIKYANSYRRSKSKKKDVPVHFSQKFINDELKPLLKQALKHDALLGRISRLICFAPFSNHVLRDLVKKVLQQWDKRLKEKKKNAQLMWTDDVLAKFQADYDCKEGERSMNFMKF